MSRSRSRVRSRTLLPVLLILGGLLASPTAWALQERTYFVPIPEDDLLASLRAIGRDRAQSPLIGVTSLTVATSGTIIRWAQQESNYDAAEYDANTNPLGTQVWGDRNAANGCPPTRTTPTPVPCTDADDFLRAGEVVFLRTRVPVSGSASPSGACTLFPDVSALSRTGDEFCYDGGDRIDSTFPLAISRAAWADNVGTLLAGAVEVPSTLDEASGAGAVEAPVGPNTPDSQRMFEYSALYIMAGETGATVTVNRPGESNPTFTLAPGEGRTIQYQSSGTNQLPVVNINSGTAQVHLITGQPTSNYETRWFYLPPVDQWSNAYIAPVGTPTNTNTGEANTQCTRLFVYNPRDNTAPSVAYSDGAGGSSTIASIPAGQALSSPQVPAGSAARITTGATGGKFYALSVTDCRGGEIYDWGYPLFAEDKLTTQFLVGWAPGCTGSTCAPVNSIPQGTRSPLWITPASGTDVNIYVDYDGKGARCLPGGGVVGRVGTLTLDAGQTAVLTNDPPGDPNTGAQGNYALTGARIFTCDGTEFAVAWGQDPRRSGSGDSQGLDLGTAAAPLGSALVCTISADKTEVLIGGDSTVTYTFSAFNEGEVPLEGISFDNDFTSGLVYLPNPPPCPSPDPALKSNGFNVGDDNDNGLLDVVEVWEFSCTVTLDTAAASDPYPPLINAAVANSTNPTLESLACEWEVNVKDIPLDFGDTPASYGDPNHLILANPQVHLGTEPPDRDPGLQASVGADGDDNDTNAPPFVGGDDEDGVTFQALVGGAIQATVQVTANGPATLCAWLDENLNDNFDSAEARDASGNVACQPVDQNTPTVILTWNFPPLTGTSPVQTYARFRLASVDDQGQPVLGIADGGSNNVDDGEIEDYALSILPTRAAIGAFRVDVVPAEGLDLTDPETGEPLIDPDTGEPLEAPPAGAAQVHWETLSEQGTLGFYLERWIPGTGQTGGQWVRLNGDLLPGLIDAPLGGEYRYTDLDVAVGEAHRYRLIELEAWGTQLTHGPYDVVVGGGAVGGTAATMVRSYDRDAAGDDESGDEDVQTRWGAAKQLAPGLQARAREARRDEAEESLRLDGVPRLRVERIRERLQDRRRQRDADADGRRRLERPWRAGDQERRIERRGEVRQ